MNDRERIAMGDLEQDLATCKRSLLSAVTERDQALADVKELQEALGRIVRLTEYQGDSWDAHVVAKAALGIDTSGPVPPAGAF